MTIPSMDVGSGDGSPNLYPLNFFVCRLYIVEPNRRTRQLGTTCLEVSESLRHNAA